MHRHITRVFFSQRHSLSRNNQFPIPTLDNCNHTGRTPHVNGESDRRELSKLADVDVRVSSEDSNCLLTFSRGYSLAVILFKTVRHFCYRFFFVIQSHSVEQQRSEVSLLCINIESLLEPPGPARVAWAGGLVAG